MSAYTPFTNYTATSSSGGALGTTVFTASKRCIFITRNNACGVYLEDASFSFSIQAIANTPACFYMNSTDRIKKLAGGFVDYIILEID